MATLCKADGRSASWSQEAFAMAAEAKVLSGHKLEQLIVRLQRHSGRSKETCWRFIIQHGLKRSVDHRRWTEAEVETLREELVKHTIDEVARKLKRTPQAIRSILKRNQLSLRDIRCDLFSLESLANALHIGTGEVRFWIDQGWLPADVQTKGTRRFYTITPEGLMHLYKHHHRDVLRRGIPNLSLFEAYAHYCFTPKHTVGDQLLDVRRDKKERQAFCSRERQPHHGSGIAMDDAPHPKDDSESILRMHKREFALSGTVAHSDEDRDETLNVTVR